MELWLEEMVEDILINYITLLIFCTSTSVPA
jgi:hypothetical protein